MALIWTYLSKLGYKFLVPKFDKHFNSAIELLLNFIEPTLFNMLPLHLQTQKKSIDEWKKDIDLFGKLYI